jgi:enamine deaminase RidA (YjgF/YER057c/UK114 family)
MSKPTIEMTSSKKETQTLLPRRDLLSAALGLGVVVGLSRSEALFAASAGRVESRLAELGITLPAAPAPLANYVAYVVEGNVAYIAGQIPMNAGELMYPGKVPTQVTVEQAKAAARQCGINILAALKSACGGDLDRVRRCVRLQGFVASADDFTAQPTVINAASDLMVEVFGDAGKHTRLALGSNVLPLDSCVEISAMFVLNP